MTRTPRRPILGVAAANPEYAEAYADAVERSGGRPRVILPEHSQQPEHTLARLGALLAVGEDGADPKGSAEGPERRTGPDEGPEPVLDHARLIEAALEADLPLLCVSLGMQVLNGAMGGKPARSVSGHGPYQQDGQEVSAYHRIFISPGSKLAAVVGSGGFVRVNSRHNTGLVDAQRSPLLVASAYSLEDGIIEALESPDHRWVIGVQFHPERRNELPPHFGRLFQSLVERAEERLSASR